MAARVFFCFFFFVCFVWFCLVFFYRVWPQFRLPLASACGRCASCQCGLLGFLTEFWIAAGVTAVVAVAAVIVAAVSVGIYSSRSRWSFPSGFLVRNWSTSRFSPRHLRPVVGEATHLIGRFYAVPIFYTFLKNKGSLTSLELEMIMAVLDKGFHWITIYLINFFLLHIY